MTYKELFDMVHDQIKHQNLGGFFDGHLEEVQVGQDPKTYKKVGFISPFFDKKTAGLDGAKKYIDQTEADYVVVLIKESAGLERNLNLQKEMLNAHRLIASIRMPASLFYSVVSVQTAIFIFEVREPYTDHIVKFFDFSVDGYARSRRKATYTLADTDHADDRYKELYARLVGQRAETGYYTAEAGTYFEDIVRGGDWEFDTHKLPKNLAITADDIQATVREYMTWKMDEMLAGEKEKVYAEFYHTYRVDELFDVEPVAGYKKETITIYDERFFCTLPIISSTSHHNGRLGYTDDTDKKRCMGQCITVATKTAQVFYQPEDFVALTGHVVALRLKGRTMTEDVAMYLVEGLRKAFAGYSWGHGLTHTLIQGAKIQLPIKSGHPDWEQIEKTVKEEKKRLLHQESEKNSVIIDIVRAMRTQG